MSNRETTQVTSRADAYRRLLETKKATSEDIGEMIDFLWGRDYQNSVTLEALERALKDRAGGTDV